MPASTLQRRNQQAQAARTGVLQCHRTAVGQGGDRRPWPTCLTVVTWYPDSCVSCDLLSRGLMLGLMRS